MNDADTCWTHAVQEGGYSVMKSIDYGSFSEVFTIEEYATGKVFALKKIESSKHAARDDERILGEIQCLANLRHRHVIQLKDIVIVEHIACIIMEYAPLGNLQQFINRGMSFSNEDALTIFQQLLSATAFCHSKDIAHRDLNPSNVLLVSTSVVKLGDFGLGFECKDADGKFRKCTEYLGQVSYLPPEVLIEAPFFPKPADVWSLGCILYFICFKTKPYTGSTKTVLGVQLNQGIVVPTLSNSTIPALFVSTLMDMCVVDVDRRPTSDCVCQHWSGYTVDSL